MRKVKLILRLFFQALNEIIMREFFRQINNGKYLKNTKLSDF